MTNGCISIERILDKLDGYLHKNDYISAERHLLYWLAEAQAGGDAKNELTVRNELMGLYRKLGKKQEALDCVAAAMDKIQALEIQGQVGAATTYLNCATVYKAFGMADKALPVFEKARAVYERELEPVDPRLGGLYNNMALALVDEGRFALANELYLKAIDVMQSGESGTLEVAITYLNMASAAEAELGLAESETTVSEYLEKARRLLEDYPKRDGYYAFVCEKCASVYGYYAFVCEKCASVYGYYGYFLYENELTERARRIYEGN